MTVEIRERQDGSFETIARVKDGEIEGENIFESFPFLEGADEEEFLRVFDGPNYVASIVDEPEAEKDRGFVSNEKSDGVVKVSELNKPNIDIEKNGVLRKAGEHFIEIDNMLMEAFEKQIWQDDLTKAPNMWERDDNIPQFVRAHVKQAIERTDTLHGTYRNIPRLASLKVHEIIQDQLTDPDGWSIETIVTELESELEGLDPEQAETIARTEVAAVLNTARELAYEARQAAEEAVEDDQITGLPDREGPDEVDIEAPDEERDIKYYWAGPEDSSTTKLCSETKDEIESRGGFVSKDELKEILREKAKKYEDESGALLNRIDSFVPHWSCRHTFIRESYQRVT